MSQRRERAVSHSLSCTALEWERIRDLADDAGTSMSRFIVDRVLGRDGWGGEGRPDGGHALVLDAGRQRAMHDAALRAESLMVRLVGHSDPRVARCARRRPCTVRGAARGHGAHRPSRNSKSAARVHRRSGARGTHPRPNRRAGEATRVTIRQRLRNPVKMITVVSHAIP